MCVCTWCFVFHVEACSIDQRKDSAQKQTQNHRPLHSQQTQANKAIDPMLNFKQFFLKLQNSVELHFTTMYNKSIIVINLLYKSKLI